jgi:hypothetical protein
MGPKRVIESGGKFAVDVIMNRVILPGRTQTKKLDCVRTIRASGTLFLLYGNVTDNTSSG